MYLVSYDLISLSLARLLINCLVNVLHPFLQCRLLLQCHRIVMLKQSYLLTAVPPGLCAETTQLEGSVLLACERKIFEMLSYVMKNCKNPTFF